MTRITRSFTGLAFAAFVAPLVAAQPAPEANEHAVRKTQCAQMHDDYLKQKQWLTAKPDLAMDDHGKGKGKKEKDSREEKDLDKMYKEYEQRCGNPPADMAMGKDMDDGKKDKPKSFQDAVKQKVEQSKGKNEPVAAPVVTTATAQPVAPAAPAAPIDLPRKAGPSEGAGVGSTRCEDLHKKMKDALARKAACGKDKKCKNTEEFGYDQLRNGFRNGGCGEIPADAEPKKGKG